MGVNHALVSVGTSAVDLTSGVTDTDQNTQIRSVVLTNTGTSSVFIGGPTVTTISYGYELKAGYELALDLTLGDAPYGIAAAGGGQLRVLHLGV